MNLCSNVQRGDDSGIILITTLWVLVVLGILAVGLGRQASLETSLTKYFLGRVKAGAAAWAGFSYAMEQIYLDSNDVGGSKDYDTLAFCGILRDKRRTAEDLFKDRQLESGVFSVEYPFKDLEGRTFMAYGLSDEERKININGINMYNTGILYYLIIRQGFSEETARQVSYSVVDWTDQDAMVSNTIYGAEDEYYLGLSRPYRTKNALFDSLEELLLVRGMTEEVFRKIESHITVFPRSRELKINFDTAGREVLLALAEFLVEAKMLREPRDAVSLVDEILAYRAGRDGLTYTDDDRAIDMNLMVLKPNEKALLNIMNAYRTRASKYLHAHIRGVDDYQRSVALIDAVVYRDEMSVVSWRRK